ncbi:hypothetical protein BD626DRAFT_255340 [Schizophyllum amplum]|uniref:Uncharacterized protein n=1 Tax=Schizophyllum amplum TaxID=97359 RepID=A0A550CIK3_9AGAR|nr:hypothetical protein BD626DRAFT_255340 [Auriculariopsis ampla]
MDCVAFDFAPPSPSPSLSTAGFTLDGGLRPQRHNSRPQHRAAPSTSRLAPSTPRLALPTLCPAPSTPRLTLNTAPRPWRRALTLDDALILNTAPHPQHRTSTLQTPSSPRESFALYSYWSSCVDVYSSVDRPPPPPLSTPRRRFDVASTLSTPLSTRLFRRPRRCSLTLPTPLQRSRLDAFVYGPPVSSWSS